MSVEMKPISGLTSTEPADDALVYEYVGIRPRQVQAEIIEGPWTLKREIEVSVHDSLDGLEMVWRQLEDNGDCLPFQSYAWLSTWQRHVGRHESVTPCVVVGWDQFGNAMFILPLGIKRGLTARTLVWLGGKLCDYQGPLLAASFSRHVGIQFRRLWDDVRAMLPRHDVILLDRMPEYIGAQANPFMQVDQLALHCSAAHLTKLNGNWDDYYGRKRSSGSKKRDRQKRRKLAEFGEVELVSPDDMAGRLASFDALVEQKTRSFKRMGIANIFDRPGYLDFYRDLICNPAADDGIQISHLRCGSDIVATNWGLSFKGRYSYILASYDDRHEAARFGPGMVQLMELMKKMADTGHDEFDFSIGDDGYKEQWCEVEVPLYDHLAAASLLGRLALLPQLLMQRAKRFIKQTPLVWAWFTRLRAALAAFPKIRPASS
ncbi:MAG: GNAT family N-acetyltransferase [Rhizobiales bacterium]|nr:GNAT family N-acetyltransferase [Hyphomicrobiales bacterium]